MIPNLLKIPLLFGLSFEVYIVCFIIAVATFFIGKWLLKNFIKTKRTRRFAALTIAVVAIPLLYLALIYLFLFWITYTPSKDFNKSPWLTNKKDRFEMAGDIINSNMLIGKDTNQVKFILGDPTWRSGTIHQPELNNSWSYNMGIGVSGFGIMFHHLIIKFYKDKVVVVEHGKFQD